MDMFTFPVRIVPEFVKVVQATGQCPSMDVDRVLLELTPADAARWLTARQSEELTVHMLQRVSHKMDPEAAPMAIALSHQELLQDSHLSVERVAEWLVLRGMYCPARAKNSAVQRPLAPAKAASLIAALVERSPPAAPGTRVLAAGGVIDYVGVGRWDDKDPQAGSSLAVCDYAPWTVVARVRALLVVRTVDGDAAQALAQACFLDLDFASVERLLGVLVFWIDARVMAREPCVTLLRAVEALTGLQRAAPRRWGPGVAEAEMEPRLLLFCVCMDSMIPCRNGCPDRLALYPPVVDKRFGITDLGPLNAPTRVLTVPQSLEGYGLTTPRTELGEDAECAFCGGAPIIVVAGPRGLAQDEPIRIPLSYVAERALHASHVLEEMINATRDEKAHQSDISHATGRLLVDHMNHCGSSEPKISEPETQMAALIASDMPTWADFHKVAGRLDTNPGIPAAAALPFYMTRVDRLTTLVDHIDGHRSASLYAKALVLLVSRWTTLVALMTDPGTILHAARQAHAISCLVKQRCHNKACYAATIMACTRLTDRLQALEVPPHVLRYGGLPPAQEQPTKRPAPQACAAGIGAGKVKGRTATVSA